MTQFSHALDMLDMNKKKLKYENKHEVPKSSHFIQNVPFLPTTLGPRSNLIQTANRVTDDFGFQVESKTSQTKRVPNYTSIIL